MTLKVQTHTPTYLSVTGQKMPKINETVCLLRFVFPVNFVFIKFATGVSARRTNRCLAWNIFLLLRCRTFWKEASGTNLITALVRSPRTLVIYLFPVIGTVYI